MVDDLQYGLNFPVSKSSVTSRKLTIFLFASTVIFRLFLANIWHISFFALSISLGVWLSTASPLSL